MSVPDTIDRPAATNAEAVIVGADLVAGHDGRSEMVVRVRYTNGVVGDVVIDAAAGFTLLKNCKIDSLNGLVGQPWRKILEGY